MVLILYIILVGVFALGFYLATITKGIMIRFVKPFKGDYFHILPCFAICVDSEEIYIKLAWFKWQMGFVKYFKT